MAEILKVFEDYLIADRPTWWVVLDCGHWYHWTGQEPPHRSGPFPCPDCAPLPKVVVPSGP